MNDLAVRAIDESPSHIKCRGLAVPFDGPFPGGKRGKDSYDTYFDENTDYCLNWYPQIPNLYDHGFDRDKKVNGKVVRGHKLIPIGTVDMQTADIDEKGLWLESQISKQAQYFDELATLLDVENNGARSQLFHSSESVEHHVIIEGDGHVKQWPLIALADTPTPSNIFAGIETAELRSAVRSAEIELEDWIEEDGIMIPYSAQRAVWSTAFINNLPDSSFAYIEPGGQKDNSGKTTPRSKRHLPYKDASGKADAPHVRNALARLDQTDIPDAAKAAAKRKLQAAAKTAGVAAKSLEIIIPDIEETATRQGAIDTEDMVEGDLNVENSMEDIIDDIEDALNGPENDMVPGSGMYSVVSTFVSAMDPMKGNVIVRCYDMDSSDNNLWKYPWELGDDGDPVLGAPTSVEQTFVVADAIKSAVPLALNAKWLQKHATALAQRTKDLVERRAGEGREVSEANRARLTEVIAGMRSACQDIERSLTPEPSTETPTEGGDEAERQREQRIHTLRMYNLRLTLPEE